MLFRDTKLTPFPEVDMYQDQSHIFVSVALPGCKPEDIQISLSDEKLVLKGKIADRSATGVSEPVLQERRHGHFSRSLPLPAKIDPEDYELRIADGLLSISLEKS